MPYVLSALIPVFCHEFAKQKKIQEELRKDMGIVLVGHPEHAISGSKLPTVSSVLNTCSTSRSKLWIGRPALHSVVDSGVFRGEIMRSWPPPGFRGAPSRITSDRQIAELRCAVPCTESHPNQNAATQPDAAH